MKVITLLLSLLISVSFVNTQKKHEVIREGKRIEKVINSQWTFNYFSSEAADKGYESPGFNDSKWPVISIPHTWNSFATTGVVIPFARPAGETGDTYWWTGWGWYRKHFTVGNDYTGYKVFIEFEGIQKYCKVWINGKFLGDHKGGYGSFDFDITGYIKSGGDNLLAVAVSNLQKDEFRIHPLTEGSYNTSCGIFRNVTVVLKDKLYIPMQGSATHEGGTSVTTPKVSEDEGIVRIKTWVKNDYEQLKTCNLQTSIYDRNKQLVQVIKSEAVVNAGQQCIFEQTSKPIKKPHLWSVEDPYLYTIVSEVTDRKDITDTYTSTMGFRWFRYDEMNGSLYLNDKSILLKGVDRHQEYPWLGDAIPGWITEKDYASVSRKMKFNFIRTINYPGDKMAYDLADKYGIITEEDFSAISKHGFSLDEQKQQIREMIRRDRNHPGILFRSFGEENVNEEIVKFAMAEDTSRIITSIHNTVDSAMTYFNYDDKKYPDDLHNGRAEEPAKVVLTSSHKKIGADRASLAIIEADLVDRNGNPVPGSKNTIRWKVTGPARLIGPAYYEAHSDSSNKPKTEWYKTMPVTNFIRSTGKPGRIEVSVFSSGLTSGSLLIDAEEVIADNSVISEPLLADEGRKPVAGIAITQERLDAIPVEIATTADDFNLPQNDKKGFATIMKDYIHGNNRLVDTLSNEYKTIIDLFALQLVNNNGRMSADDYNFNVAHYNSCRLISGYIAKTKLPPLFKESLRKYYSRTIIKQGCEKNAGDEMNWLNWIPSGGIVVVIPSDGAGTNQKGVVYTKQTGLPEIIRAVYPQFSRFSQEAKERALLFISKMNPNVHVITLNDAGNTLKNEMIPSITYSAEKGEPILIPEYKFISE